MKEKKAFKGWIIVVLATVIMTLVGNFQSNVHTVANAIMMASPENTISSVTHGFVWTVVIGMGVVMAPLAGVLADKYGPKILYMIGAVLSAIGGLVLVKFQPNNGFIYVLNCGVIYSIAFMFTGSVTAAKLVNGWIYKQRGTANSIINSGTVFAGVVTPIIANAIIQKAGGNWQSAYYFYGITSIVGFICCFFLINKPSDIGQYPDNNPNSVLTDEAHKVTYKVYKNTSPETQYEFKDVIKMPFFWVLLIVFTGLQALSSYLMSPGAVKFLRAGFEMSQVSVVLSVRQVVRLVFLLFMMKYSDQIEPLKLLAIICGAVAVSYLASSSLQHLWQIYVFYFAGSIANSTCLFLPGVILCNIFGNKNLGKIFGFSYAFAALVSSPLSTIVGVIYEKTGSYISADYLHAAIGAVTVVLIIVALGFLKKEKEKMTVNAPEKV